MVILFNNTRLYIDDESFPFYVNFFLFFFLLCTLRVLSTTSIYGKICVCTRVVKGCGCYQWKQKVSLCLLKGLSYQNTFRRFNIWKWIYTFLLHNPSSCGLCLETKKIKTNQFHWMTTLRINFSKNKHKSFIHSSSHIAYALQQIAYSFYYEQMDGLMWFWSAPSSSILLFSEKTLAFLVQPFSFTSMWYICVSHS